MRLDHFPPEMLLLIADFCSIENVRNFYVCNKYLENTFTQKSSFFYLLKRIFKEIRVYYHLRDSNLGKTLIAHALGNLHEIYEIPPDNIAIDLNHINIS